MTNVSNAFLSEQEVMIRESARRVASEVVARTAAERDRSSAWPYDEIRAVAEVGFMGMLAPQAYGGAGLSFVEYCLAIEEFAAADGGFATLMHVHNSSAHVLRSFGTEEQMQLYLPELANAQRIGAFTFAEHAVGCTTAPAPRPKAMATAMCSMAANNGYPTAARPALPWW